MKMNEEEELSYQVATVIYSFLKKNENLATVVQNALLFVSPLKSFFFLFSVNLVFTIFYMCHFSIFSYIFIFISLRSIPIEYTHKFFHFLFYYFYCPSEKEKYFLTKPLPMDHLCCLLAILYVKARKFIDFYIVSVQKARLIDVSLLTVNQFALFYIIYILGDPFCVWFTIHFTCIFPLLLIKRIGFEIFHFPVKTEKRILFYLQKRNKEEEEIRKAEEALRRAELDRKAEEEVRRLAEIAVLNEKTETIDSSSSEEKLPKSLSSELKKMDILGQINKLNNMNNTNNQFNLIQINGIKSTSDFPISRSADSISNED